MSEQIDGIIRRTRGYWYSDGFIELFIGGLFALIGGLLFVQSRVLSGSALMIVFAVGVPLLIIGGSLLSKQVVRSLKERITYPRTGYIAYEKKRNTGQRRWVIPAFALLIALAYIVADLLTSDTQVDLSRFGVAFMVGLIGGASFAYVGYTVGVARFYVLGALAAVLGIAVTVAGLGDVLGTAVVITGLGVAQVISGALTLAIYLSRNRETTEEAD
jgi:MFS family permease